MQTKLEKTEALLLLEEACLEFKKQEKPLVSHQIQMSLGRKIKEYQENKTQKYHLN